MIDPGLEGKVALVTGANHGIGAAAARALAAQGARVFATYFRPPCPASEEDLAKAAEAGIGGPLLYWARQHQTVQDFAATEADLGKPENAGVVFDACESALGPVDILVNNHAHCVKDTFDPAAVTTEGYAVGFFSAGVADAHFAVNARAYALTMSEYIRRYLQRGARWGRIINISTDAAHCHAYSVSYAATKHAIESYSRSATLETGKYGITVNIVAPGPIQTGWLTPEQESSIAAATPLGRCGLPGDVADVIVFLASNQAHWLTGQLNLAGRAAENPDRMRDVPGSISTAQRALLAAALTALFALGAAIDTRQPAPRFTGKTLDGERFTNDTLKGKVVLLQFWATWCGFCRRDQPAVDALVKDFSRKGLVTIAVNVAESRKKVTEYLKQSPRACKIVLTEDTNLAAMFAPRGFPLYILIDREGKIAGKQEGSGGEAALRRLIARAGLEAE